MSEITQEKYNELLGKIKVLQEELDSFTVINDWTKGEDVLIVNSEEFENESIEFKCNYSSWNTIKTESKEKEALHVVVCQSYNQEASVSISLEGMKQLRDYLSHKIEYLEGE